MQKTQKTIKILNFDFFCRHWRIYHNLAFNCELPSSLKEFHLDYLCLRVDFITFMQKIEKYREYYKND